MHKPRINKVLPNIHSVTKLKIFHNEYSHTYSRIHTAHTHFLRACGSPLKKCATLTVRTFGTLEFASTLEMRVTS